MATKQSTRAPEGQSIPESLIARIMDAACMIEIARRALDSDDEHADEWHVLRRVVKDLHEVHSELEFLTRPGPAEQLRILEELPEGAMDPAERDRLIAECKEALAAKGEAPQPVASDSPGLPEALAGHLEEAQDRAAELQEFLQHMADHDEEQAGIFTMGVRTARDINEALDASTLRKVLAGEVPA